MSAYQAQLFNAAYRILGDEEAAVDAARAALLSAYRGREAGHGHLSKTWILQALTRACYDRLRRRQHRPASSREMPAEDLEKQDVGQAVQRGLQTLDADQRTAVVLCDIQGLSYAEIAEVVGVPARIVRSRIGHGRAQLRDYLLDLARSNDFNRSPHPND